MKRPLVIALVSLLAAALAAPAPAGAQTVQSLSRQIKALQKEVKTLKRQVTQARQIASSALVYSACTTAVTADAFQSTWTFLDTKHASGFGPQTPLSDFDTCRPLRITRAPATPPNPPNTGVFNSLLALFR
jgi:type II secretory pathway pseudopilin PulG